MNTTIEVIRNVLRLEGITGIDSITHCIAFTLSRYLTMERCKKVGIPEEYGFEKLIELSKTDALATYGKFYTPFNSKNPVYSLVYYLTTIFGFKAIRDFKLKREDNLKLIIEKLEKLKLDSIDIQYDIVGTIYELHLRTGTSNAMRDLGQYFTHRLTIQYMIELAKPTIDDVIIDPTCGTGGFLTMTAKYLNKHYTEINWKEQHKNLYGFDLDNNVQNMCSLNLLLETNVKFDNIIQRNTLYDDIRVSDDVAPLTADVILANEPMGVKNLQHAKCCDRIKDLKIRGTKCEPLFLQEFMQALNDNGRCAVIVPDGVLTNESTLHKGTRKHLIENFKLLKVISLKDKEFFMNTGVSASILFFKKNGSKTEKVKFLEIKLKDGGIEETPIVEASYDDIKSKGYSLFVNKYKPKNEIRFDGVEYKKLGDVLVKHSGKSLSKNSMIDGNYPVIGGGSHIIDHHNEFNHDGQFIFIARVGTAGSVSHYTGKCFITDLVGAFTVKDVDYKYLYYFLKFHEEHIKDTYVKKTAAPSLNLGYFLDDYKIPIPSLEIQKMIVERLDTLSENNKTCRKLIQNTKQIMKYYVEAQTIHEPKKKLGEMLKYREKKNKYSATDGNISGLYRFYTSSQNKLQFRDDYEYKDNHLVIGRGGNSCIHYANKFSAWILLLGPLSTWTYTCPGCPMRLLVWLLLSLILVRKLLIVFCQEGSHHAL